MLPNSIGKFIQFKNLYINSHSFNKESSNDLLEMFKRNEDSKQPFLTLLVIMSEIWTIYWTLASYICGARD